MNERGAGCVRYWNMMHMYVLSAVVGKEKLFFCFPGMSLILKGPKGLLLTLLDRRIKIGEQIAIDWNSNCNSDNIHKV